jgi:hypothetical protein
LELTPRQQVELVANLRAALRRAASSAGAPVPLIEPHISYLLIAQGDAYKLRKIVKLDVLDVSTREQRQSDCARELALNRRYAPQLCLDVVPTPAACRRPFWGVSARCWTTCGGCVRSHKTACGTAWRRAGNGRWRTSTRWS